MLCLQDANIFCKLPLTHTCRVLSALAHWSAIFGETEYLPLLAFPFVKLFQNNPLICFEVVATVIGTHTKWMNTMQHICIHIGLYKQFLRRCNPLILE